MRKFQVTVNGNTYEVEVAEVGGVAGSVAPVAATPVSQGKAPSKAPVVAAPVVAAPVAKAPVAIAPVAPAPVASEIGSTLLEAPMIGKIVGLKVAVGQAVKSGDVIAVLEAMKMENELVAPKAGTVVSVNVTVGQQVEAGDLIASLN